MADSPWPDIGAQLDEAYKTEYLFHQGYKSDNFMDLLIPPKTYINNNDEIRDTETILFGVKSFNIFIVQKLYGWEGAKTNQDFVWDDEGSEFSTNFQESLDRWERIRPRFSSYKCHIWVDMYSANKVKEDYPSSKYPEMLQRTADKIESIFTGDAVVGFVYEGVLDTLPEMGFFQGKIDAFFGTPAYKLPKTP